MIDNRTHVQPFTKSASQKPSGQALALNPYIVENSYARDALPSAHPMR